MILFQFRGTAIKHEAIILYILDCNNPAAQDSSLQQILWNMEQEGVPRGLGVSQDGRRGK